MKDKLFIIGKLIGVLVFVLAFSMVGIASGKPIMILAFAGFFLAVMFVVFQFVRKNQRHFEIVSEKSRLIPKIIGKIMVLAAVILPALSISSLQLFNMGTLTIGVFAFILILLISLGLIAGGVFAVTLINKSVNSTLHRILGYAIIVILSAVPALLVIPYDKTTTGIGSIYYVAILVAILSWWGLSLYLNKE